MDDLDGQNPSICNIVVVYNHGFKYWKELGPALAILVIQISFFGHFSL